MWLALYANALSDSNRNEEAITAAEESLALALADLDRLDEALVPAEESVAAYRNAIPRREDRPLGSTVNALRIYGRTLNRLGRPEDAVTSAREALAITRRLAETDPDTHRPLTADRLPAPSRQKRHTPTEPQP